MKATDRHATFTDDMYRVPYPTKQRTIGACVPFLNIILEALVANLLTFEVYVGFIKT
jgi:hypothetical protein